MAASINGPFALGVLRGKGARLQPVLQRGHTPNVDGRKASVHCMGDLGEDTKDSVLVALSFARAHAPWLRSRYGLYIDPRQNKPADFLFNIHGLQRGVRGDSVGAALAGKAAQSVPYKSAALCWPASARVV